MKAFKYSMYSFTIIFMECNSVAHKTVDRYFNIYFLQIPLMWRVCSKIPDSPNSFSSQENVCTINVLNFAVGGNALCDVYHIIIIFFNNVIKFHK